MLSYLLLITLFLLVSITLTIIKAFSTYIHNHHISRINLRTSGVVLKFFSSGVAESSLPLSRSILAELFASQSSSLSLGLPKFPFQVMEFLVSEMLLGEHSSAL